MEDDELFLISMAAEALGMHPQTLRKYERLRIHPQRFRRHADEKQLVVFQAKSPARQPG